MNTPRVNVDRFEFKGEEGYFNEPGFEFGKIWVLLLFLPYFGMFVLMLLGK